MVSLVKLLVVFLFSLNAYAVTPSGVPKIGLGGVGNVTASGTGISLPATLEIEASNPLNYFTLVCGNSAFTNNTVYPCYKDGAAYQVVGNTMECSGILTVSNVTAQAQLLSDSVAITPASVTGALTTPIYQGGLASNYVLLHQTAGTAYSYGILWKTTQNKYPGVQASLANNHFWVMMTCREF